jgi:3-hydroxypropanoate dehydrogenase
MERAVLDEPGRDLLFRAARTHSAWLDRPVEEAKLVELYELLKWGPTSANGQPLRVLFLKSRAAKERLRPALSPGNVAKTMAAPVTAILAYDTRFFEFLPKTFPHEPEAVSWFSGPGKESAALETAFRNGSLQGGYFILAARAVGLDCGPMSGFDRARVDAEFFPDGRLRSNFLCNLGYGDPARLPPRNPRLSFAEACRIL